MPENYVLLERTELNTSAASVTFANIPQTGYTDLKVVISGRDSSSAGISADGYSFTILPNGSSSNISQRSLVGSGSNSFPTGSYSDSSMFNAINMNADTSNVFSNVEIHVPNYRSSNVKSFSIDGASENNGTRALIRISAGLWNSTAAITSLQLNAYTTWMAGSTFSLYGVANLNTTPAIAPKASGGNIIENDGTYWIHTFLNSGTFTPAVALSCDVLVVAGGGGGGGYYSSGGGGAGGFRTSTSFATVASPYSITVGAGGSKGTGAQHGSRGSDSVFSTITSNGGGGGAYDNQNAVAGTYGSGAGGSNSGTGSAGTSGQGTNGGNGANGGNAGFEPQQAGGGGGGAGTAGATATSGSNTSTGGAGGNGSSSSISGTSVTYAGGGGGGANNAGAGGSGGGGTGGSFSVPAAVNGTTNLGAGGGGGGRGASGVGGNGGSGIIIIRYPIV
jgi:hypothetical protein